LSSQAKASLIRCFILLAQPVADGAKVYTEKFRSLTLIAAGKLHGLFQIGLLNGKEDLVKIDSPVNILKVKPAPLDALRFLCMEMNGNIFISFIEQ